MKTKKELKEEIERIKGKFMNKHLGLNADDGIKVKELETKLKTLQKRNAEVKQAIENWIFSLELINDWRRFTSEDYKELLQKLGLGK